MSKRHPNHRLVKIHRSYTVEEVALRFGYHKNTVRAWVKAGLPVCDSGHPTLIYGPELAAFLKTRRTESKRPCKPGEMYCVRCRAPRRPAGDMADYLPVTDRFGNLQGICPICDRMMYRRANFGRLNKNSGELKITIREGQRRVNDSTSPTVGSDFG